MSKKKIAPTAVDKTNTLTMIQVDGKTKEQVLAEVSLSPVTNNAVTARTYAKGNMGELGINECIEVLNARCAQVHGGSLADAESLLVSQAVALDTIFNELARRASFNLGAHLGAVETYLRLALKAQSQCRTTIEALAEIKNPRSVAFVRQANIANGPQQVNNGIAAQYARARAGAGNQNPAQSKLLEASTDGEWMDTGATGETGGSDKEMATVGAINRPQVR